MKVFVNWAIEVKGHKMNNPFAHAELTFDKKEKTIITKAEFENLIEVTTHENRWVIYCGEKRNYYKEWLSSAFRLALETGVRTEELVVMKWKDILELEEGVMVLKINNLKVNRIQTGMDSENNIRHIPITQSLRKLLIELGFNEKRGTDEYIIDRQREELSTKYMMQIISRGFSHYIKLASSRKIEFKDLRKTYITHMAMALGDKTKLFTGHSSDEILKSHYVSSAYLAGNLSDFKMF